MTSESLREQVEKRIALNRDLMTCTKNDGVIVSCDSVIRELEQVLTLIDEKARELKFRLEDLQDAGDVVGDPDIKMHFYREWAGVNYALNLLVGKQKDG